MSKLTKVRVCSTGTASFNDGDVLNVGYTGRIPFIVDLTGDRYYFNLEKGTGGWYVPQNSMLAPSIELGLLLEEVKPNLKNLREKALQAFDAGLLNKVSVRRDNTLRVLTYSNSSDCREFGELDVAEGLQYIKSLYKKTFTVETQEDVEGIRVGAEGVLLNGEEFKIVFREPNAEWGVRLNASFSNSTVAVSLPVLKGATITQ